MGGSVLPAGFLPPGAGLSAAMGADMNASLANSIFHGSAGMAAFGRNPMVVEFTFGNRYTMHRILREML